MTSEEIPSSNDVESDSNGLSFEEPHTLRFQPRDEVCLETAYSFTGLLDHVHLKESVMAGAVRGIARIPLEQPFDVVKTTHQSNPSYANARAVIRSLYHSETGLRAFYRGAIPNAIKSLLKESCRYVAWEL